jgi:hypothetical protein
MTVQPNQKCVLNSELDEVVVETPEIIPDIYIVSDSQSIFILTKIILFLFMSFA